MAFIHKLFIFFVLLVFLPTFPSVSEELHFKGRVQTKGETVDIESCYVIKVADLVQEQYPDESKDFVYLAYAAIFDGYGGFDYDTCNEWCCAYWNNRPCLCIRVIQTDVENLNPEEYLCAGEFTRPFTFTGKVQTIDGEKYVEECFAITVMEDLAEFLEDDETEDATGFFLNDEGEFDYKECDAYCVTYCTTGKPNALQNIVNQCLKVIESSHVNVTPNQYLCGCNIQFRV